jgi:hypothetical protein
MKKPFYIVEKKHGRERRFTRSLNCRDKYKTLSLADREINRLGGANVTYRIVRLNADDTRTAIKRP